MPWYHRGMRLKQFCWGASAGFLFSIAIPAVAHPLDVAYLDFGKTTDGQLTLTAAVHPYQAFELVRDTSVVRFELAKLQKNGDLISAYVQDHVRVTRGGAPCEWQAGSANTPPTEIEAIGDGVTVAGELACQSDASDVLVESTIFLDGFPSQTTVLRLDLPDGFADRVTLDRSHRTGSVDVHNLFVIGGATQDMSRASANRRPDAVLGSVAQRLLDPGIGWWGMISLLFAACVIGALHALGPGHGKSLLAAMLVGERATFRHLLGLGTVMTVTHVSDVFFMALVAGAVSAILPPTQLLNILQAISAVGLIGFGLYGIVRSWIRFRLIQNNPEFGDEEEAHIRAHALGMPHAHGAAEASYRRALWMGFIGSLAPCPTAWAVFLGTVSAGRAGVGVALLVAFTLGLYATIMFVGVLLLKSRAFALRHTPARVTYALPILSSVLVTALGVAFLIRLVFSVKI